MTNKRMTSSVLARSRTATHISLVCQFNVKSLIIDNQTENVEFKDLRVGIIEKSQLDRLHDDFSCHVKLAVVLDNELDVIFPHLNFDKMYLEVKMTTISKHCLEARMKFNKYYHEAMISEKRNLIGFFIYAFTTFVMRHNPRGDYNIYYDLNIEDLPENKRKEYYISLMKTRYYDLNERALKKYQRYYKAAIKNNEFP
jgi:hypothetical protein